MYLLSDGFFARRFRESVAPALLGGYAATIALTPTLTGKLILFGPLFAAALLGWILYRPGRWLYVFFFSLLALPPCRPQTEAIQEFTWLLWWPLSDCSWD